MNAGSSGALTLDDYRYAAQVLQCTPAAIYAVATVESGGRPGDTTYGPVILNERHKFYAFSGRFPVSRDYPHLSHPKAGGYCKGRGFEAKQKCEHARLQEKMTIFGGVLVEAALLSISMGKYQVMGFNYMHLGYTSVHQMWEAAQEIDDAIDLQWFVDIVRAFGLDDELCRLDWRGFARGYNGPAYEKNDYHIKLPAAFEKAETMF